MPDRVPFVALDRQHAPIAEELRAAFERVVGMSGFILGSEVAAFEEEFAAYCGVEHCVGVASGTAALTLAFQAAGIGHGDEVIVPAHTYIASALGVVHAGATPVFCDVEDGTGLIDLTTAGDLASERTSAVLAVHLYGQTADMDAVHAFAARHGLAVFEDAAQAHGATWRGRRAGSLGTTAAFSFYPSKNLGALGDGGAICTSDEAVAAKARALRHIGQRRKGVHELMGWNERLDAWNAARRRHAAELRNALGSGPLQLLAERDESPSVYHLFPVRARERDALARTLDEAGIETGIHYAPACHRQPPFDAGQSERCPVAVAWAAEEVSLPMFEHLTAPEIDRIAAACETAVGGVETAAPG